MPVGSGAHPGRGGHLRVGAREATGRNDKTARLLLFAAPWGSSGRFVGYRQALYRRSDAPTCGDAFRRSLLVVFGDRPR